MTEIRCPNCVQTNKLAALQCGGCGLPFTNLPASAFVTTDEPGTSYQPGASFGAPPLQTYEPAAFDAPPISSDRDETGRKTFFWYRMYLGVMMLLYMGVAIFGASIAYFQPALDRQGPEETLLMGVIYGLLGAVFFLVHLVALVLPPKPYNWIVGIMMIAIGMTSCCLWPVVIPLLVFWVKPETKSYLGRK
jgi:hypothetical protein